MRHGKYIGPFRELRGCGALIRQHHEHSYGGRYVLAQFDSVKAPEAASMCYGWHCLPARHFKLRRSLSQSQWRRLRGPLRVYETTRYKGPAGEPPPRRIPDTPQMRALQRYDPDTYREVLIRRDQSGWMP